MSIKSMDDLPDVEHTFQYRVDFAELLVPEGGYNLRFAQQHDPCNDVMPLHPVFYDYVHQDERGYFIADKDGNRWIVEVDRDL